MTDEARMPLMEHLKELRRRFRNAIIWVVIWTGLAYTFADETLALAARPLMRAWDETKLGPRSLKFTAVTEPFWLQMKLSLYVGLFLASPFVFYQLWKFIAPGLRKNERGVALPFAICSGLFFCGGGLFCYFLVFPRAFSFFLSYANSGFGKFSTVFGVKYQIGSTFRVEPVLVLSPYIDFVLMSVLGFGIVFELPLLIYFLSRVGLVTHRSLWRFNKYWVVIAFAVGAVLTPGPDVVSQFLMATPLIVLYELSIIVAWLVTRGRERRKAAEEAALDDD